MLLYIDEDEELPDKLRSILAQYEFAKSIQSWDTKGVHVPEEHPILKNVFHEREDEGHVFKVFYAILWTCLLLAGNYIYSVSACAENWAFHSKGRS